MEKLSEMLRQCTYVPTPLGEQLFNYWCYGHCVPKVSLTVMCVWAEFLANSTLERTKNRSCVRSQVSYASSGWEHDVLLPPVDILHVAASMAA